MTITEVITLADKNARARGLKWIVTTKETDRVRHAGRIRMVAANGCHECPIEVAAGISNIMTAIDELHLNEEQIHVRQSILRAADNNFYPEFMGDREHERDITTRQLMLDTFEFEVKP
jgi:hypothetical protein